MRFADDVLLRVHWGRVRDEKLAKMRHRSKPVAPRGATERAAEGSQA